ncbi:MAG: enoyl-CoA hydratase/isomerase family protein [Burkholderiales bacterium]|nr:enoyl-CoA hydratase/isomerase family protein [Burkholderiales bacterium]
MTRHLRIRRESDQHLGRITIDRAGSGNLISIEIARAMAQAIKAFSMDDDIKVIVIEGAGEDLTCGFDPAELETLFRDAPGGRARKVPSQRARLLALSELWWGPDGLYMRLLRCPKVTVLAAQGACSEVGLYLALCCDLVLAADTARFDNARWRHLGVDGDISLLVAAVGLKRAKELMLFGLSWNARQASDYGLVDEVVPAGELSARVAQTAGVCAQVMRDAIVAEKHVVFASLEKMQIGMGFATANAVGAWASNLHFRDGEFNFLKQARDHGMAEALQRAKAHFSS